MIYRCVSLYSLFSLLVKSCTFLVTCHILKNFLHIFGGHKILWVHLHYFNNQYLCSHCSGKFYAQLHRIHFMFNPTLIQQDFMVSSSLIPSPKEEKGPDFSCSRMCKYYAHFTPPYTTSVLLPSG